MAKRLIKSAEENLNAENQFELDEQAIDEISNAEEFADVEITNEDIMDAVEAIDALATAVIEKADGEEKEVDADELLDAVRDMIDESHEEPAEEEFPEEEELPEELTNSVVRVMVSEDGAIDLEQKPDEVYDQTVDGLECTVFDTTDEYPIDMEDTAAEEEVEDDVLVIGNSKTNKYRKGYVRIKSAINKKAWSSAFKKVKKMIGSAKFTAAHWVIVSALAKKEEENDKLQKKIECKLIRMIRSNKELKSKFMKAIKSDFSEDVAGQDTQDDIQPEGQTQAEAKPDMVAEPQNNGVEENVAAPSETGDPDGVTEEFGNPTEDPATQEEREGEIALPEEDIIIVDVPLTNSTRKVRLQKVRSSKTRKYNLYKVVSGKDNSILDGKVIKNGKLAFAFKNTIHGVIACCAQFVPSGKGAYKPVLKNNRVIIAHGGEPATVFQNFEKIQLAKAVLSARKEGYAQGLKKNRIISNGSARTIRERKDEILNSRRTPARTPVKSGMSDERRRAILSREETKRAKINERKALQSKAELIKMHEAEERQKLFQSSLTQMNEEKVVLKSNNARNNAALEKMYDGMF